MSCKEWDDRLCRPRSSPPGIFMVVYTRQCTDCQEKNPCWAHPIRIPCAGHDNRCSSDLSPSEAECNHLYGGRTRCDVSSGPTSLGRAEVENVRPRFHSLPYHYITGQNVFVLNNILFRIQYIIGRKGVPRAAQVLAAPWVCCWAMSIILRITDSVARRRFV